MGLFEDLIKIVGKEKLEIVCRNLGGERVYIPHTIKYVDRDDRMKEEFDEKLYSGSTCMNAYRDLAGEFGLSVRRVQSIINARS